MQGNLNNTTTAGGEYDLDLLSAHPYIGWRVGLVDIRATVGYGQGTLDTRTADQTTTARDISLRTLAVSRRRGRVANRRHHAAAQRGIAHHRTGREQHRRPARPDRRRPPAARHAGSRADAPVCGRRAVEAVIGSGHAQRRRRWGNRRGRGSRRRVALYPLPRHRRMARPRPAGAQRRL